MDLRARSKLAFVVERYGVEEPSEAGRRTRSIAAAMADRGHGVSVLTTCTRHHDGWDNELAEGETGLDGVRVLRFKVDRPRHVRLEEAASRLTRVHPVASRAWSHAHGPVSRAYLAYLDRLGFMFDAVFFCGEWSFMVLEGVRRVHRAVLAPPPCEDPTRRFAHVKSLVPSVRALAVATDSERASLALEVGAPLDLETFVTGACPEPLPEQTGQHHSRRLVQGPFLLHNGVHGRHVRELMEGFAAFREAHVTTPFEDDAGARFLGRELRLVLTGDFSHPHAPEAGVLSLGPVDDVTRANLLRSALASVQCSPEARLPAGLIEAWSSGRATLVLGKSAALGAVFELVGAEYTYDSPATFASCAAALLSRRGPREAFGIRARDVVRRLYSPGQVVVALEACMQALRKGREPSTAEANGR